MVLAVVRSAAVGSAADASDARSPCISISISIRIRIRIRGVSIGSTPVVVHTGDVGLTSMTRVIAWPPNHPNAIAALIRGYDGIRLYVGSCQCTRIACCASDPRMRLAHGDRRT